jgi:HlyD family secretion protein
MTMARKTNLRWLVLAALAAAATALLIFLFWPRPQLVEAAQVRRGPITETVADQGVARVRRTYVVSAPVGGRLERLPLEVGDRVEAGKTVVARLTPAAAGFLDPRARAQAQATISAARSGLAAAEAQRAQLEAEAVRASGELARLTPLAHKGFLSTQALDNARAAAEAARNAVRAAEAQVRARRADLAAAQSLLTTPEADRAGAVALTSPASGVVTRLLQQSERDVAAGAPLVEVGEIRGLEAQIEFLSQDAVKIRPGQRAEIYDWGGPRPIPAEVRLVEPQAFTKVSALGVEEQRALVMLQFTGPASDWAGLEPGYRVWGRVYLRETPSAVVAPIGALVRDKGGWAVCRIERGRARLRPVRVGALTDQAAEILGGAAVGDQLVVFPSDQVRDGARVRARAPGTP